MFLLCIGIPLSIWDHEALWNTVSRHWHCHLVAWSVRKEVGAAKRGERQGSSSLYSSSPTHRDHSAEENAHNCSELFRMVKIEESEVEPHTEATSPFYFNLIQFFAIVIPACNECTLTQVHFHLLP